MFFCPKCNNLYSKIVPTLPQQNISDASKQSGGNATVIKENINIVSDMDDMNNVNNVLSETPTSVSSDYTLAETSNIKGGRSESDKDADYESIIKNIVNNDNFDNLKLTPTDTLLEGLTKSGSYKKLSTKQKELVYNKLQDLIPKKLETVSDTTVTSHKAFFICTNCGYNDVVTPGTMIIRRSADINNMQDSDVATINNNYKDMLHLKELPWTRNYVCVNKSCKSHTDHALREAVFFRMPNSYKVRYVCNTCETSWT